MHYHAENTEFFGIAMQNLFYVATFLAISMAINCWHAVNTKVSLLIRLKFLFKNICIILNIKMPFAAVNEHRRKQNS